MVLEDFFTLTEMKDGLTTIARVEELIAVMQTSDCIMKNTGDTARQWSAVATVLIATGSKHCLSQFIQSDGLCFLNRWLQVAQKCNDDKSCSFVEESVSALLGALEKLPLNNERLNTSGIRETIKHLLRHKNVEVQDKARSLLASWNHVEDKDSVCQHVVKGGAHCDGHDRDDDLKPSDEMNISMENVCTKSPVHDLSPTKETCEGTVSKHPEFTKGSDYSLLESIEDVTIPTSNQDMSLASSNHADVNGYQDVNSLGCSIMSNSCQESLTITEQSHLYTVEVTTSGGTCSPLIPGDRNIDIDKSSDVSKLKDRNVNDRSSEDNKDMEIEMNMEERNPCKYSKKEICPTYSRVDQLDALSPCPANDLNSPKEPDESCDIRSRGPFNKERVSEPDFNVRKGEVSVLACPKLMMDEVGRKSPEMELKYGLDDALEVARRVAKEVEREVVDYREPLCSSSSEKNVESEMVQLSSPDSGEGEHDESMIKKPNEDDVSKEQDLYDGGSCSKKQDLCDGGMSLKAKPLKISNDIDTEPEYRVNNLKSPKAAAIAQETDNGNDKSICSFDLNEDVCTDEIEYSATVYQSVSVSAPIPVVAAFKGVPASHNIPLHFEGEQGWRGSAATSAFRAPSPRRTPDREKASLIDGSSNGSKQGRNLIEIDLNVAEIGDDAIFDLASSAKLVPVSSGLHSVDDTVEVSSTRAKRPKLDLNCAGEDDDDACAFYSSDWKAKGQLYYHQNGKAVPSPASSSSSRQTPMRNFDLNDNPSFFDVHGSHDHPFNNGKAPYQTKSYGSFRLEEPAVSIMGSKIDFGRKGILNQTHSFLTNRQGVEPAHASSLVRATDGSGQPLVTFSTAPYPTFGFNGPAMGSSMPLHPQLYGGTLGSVPYMMDSRGSTVISPMLASSSTDPTSFTRPFFMNVTDAPSGSNGGGSSQTGHDSSSGVTSVTADGRGMGTFTQQLFGHGPGSLMEEQMKSASANAGMSLKRKEPECEWEQNMANYKQEALWR